MDVIVITQPSAKMMGENAPHSHSVASVKFLSKRILIP